MDILIGTVITRVAEILAEHHAVMPRSSMWVTPIT